MSTVSQQLAADAIMPPAPAEPIPVSADDPAVRGLPRFVAGPVALGLALVGYVPAVAQAGALLTLATLRLPVAFTAVIALVVLALVLLTIGTLNADTTLTKAAGWVTFVFAALWLYLFLSAAAVATDGKGHPLCPPIVP